MVTFCSWMPLIVSLCEKARFSELVAHISLLVELSELTTLTEYDPCAHVHVHPLAPKRDEMKLCPAVLCWLPALPVTCSCHFEKSPRLDTVPFPIRWLIQVFSLTSLANEPKPPHKSAWDETHLELWNTSIAPPALSIPSNTIKNLFLRLASTAGVKGNWTGLTAWETEVLQVKHEVFKSWLRWNCSLLHGISAFWKKGTASLWSILRLSFSLLLQSLWATLEK